jgi:Uma2 family endonuclease
VPNLAVEIVSPKNYANEVVHKIEDYFRSGVQRVWVIYPEVSKVYDYDSPTLVQVLTMDQTLVGRNVLPGWELPLEAIFQSEAV